MTLGKGVGSWSFVSFGVLANISWCLGWFLLLSSVECLVVLYGAVRGCMSDTLSNLVVTDRSVAACRSMSFGCFEVVYVVIWCCCFGRRHKVTLGRCVGSWVFVSSGVLAYCVLVLCMVSFIF